MALIVFKSSNASASSAVLLHNDSRLSMFVLNADIDLDRIVADNDDVLD